MTDDTMASKFNFFEGKSGLIAFIFYDIYARSRERALPVCKFYSPLGEELWQGVGGRGSAPPPRTNKKEPRRSGALSARKAPPCVP